MATRQNKKTKNRTLMIDPLEERLVMSADTGLDLDDMQKWLELGKNDWQKINSYLVQRLDAWVTGQDRPRSDESAYWLPIEASANGSVDQLLNDLQNLGLAFGETYENSVGGVLPLESLPELVELSSLRWAYASPVGGSAQTNSTDADDDLPIHSAGDQAIGADQLRQPLGLTGEGVTVGIISDSFDQTGAKGGTTADILNGELPTNVNILSDPLAGASDEGRALAQIVHDVAPGAALAFHSAGSSTVSMANAVLELAQAGSDIIIDDISFDYQPFFQEGFVSRAISRVTSQGITFVTAAGNQGNQSYESAPRTSSSLFEVQGLSLGYAHDFDASVGTDYTQAVTIPQGSSFLLQMQWDQPFYSLSPQSGGASTDYDVYLLDETGTQIHAFSANQNIGKDALEVLRFTNTSGTENFQLVITRTQGPEANVVKTIYQGSGVEVLEYDTASSTIYGHRSNLAAFTVGAVSADQLTGLTTGVGKVADYSSTGGQTLYFYSNGQRLAEPFMPSKPDAFAPDGVNTSFFPTEPLERTDTDGDGNPNFYGSSASAAHVAGVLALLKENSPSASPTQLRSALRDTSIPLETTSETTSPGLVRADRAFHRLSTTSSIFIDGTNSDDVISLGYKDGENPELGIDVVVNGQLVKTVPTSVQRLVVSGWAGDDILRLLDPIMTPIFFEAGAGTDRLDLSPVAEQTTVVLDIDFSLPTGRAGGMFRDLEIIQTGQGNDVFLAPAELESLAGPHQQVSKISVEAGQGENRLELMAWNTLPTTPPGEADQTQQLETENITQVDRPLFVSSIFSSLITASTDHSDDARGRVHAQTPAARALFIPLDDELESDEV